MKLNPTYVAIGAGLALVVVILYYGLIVPWIKEMKSRSDNDDY